MQLTFALKKMNERNEEKIEKIEAMKQKIETEKLTFALMQRLIQ